MTEPAGGPSQWIIVGGAGFLGSHVTDRLLDDEATDAVVVYDDFSSGTESRIRHRMDDPRLVVVPADAHDTSRLAEAMAGMDAAIHLAANPDIARAAEEPAIDFDQGTALTHAVLEAMRLAGVGRILFASGSGVYGDLGETEAAEDFGPMRPVSTYGASKLASEAMISAYAHLFGLTARVFRFGNVVGPRQTHGVGLDFLAKLRRDPSRLEIMGDGNQSKPYIHVDDVAAAVLLADQKAGEGFQVFNVATDDHVTVTEIADMACRATGLDPAAVEYRYSGGARGWSGDVPVVRLDCRRIRGLGWTCAHSSAEAVRLSLKALIEDARIGEP
ncbi:MAG: NAD-dependent epimerase/dehydratase family protein [Rhodospirillales bacterium]